MDTSFDLKENLHKMHGDGTDGHGIYLSGQLNKSIGKLSKTSTPADITPILALIAELQTETQRAYHLNAVANKTAISRRALQKDLAAMLASRNGTGETICENVLITHPAYHVGNDFLLLGFKETTVVDGKPDDVNLFIIATGEKYAYHADVKTIKLFDYTLVLDQRGRVLLSVTDRWNKTRLIEFIEKPQAPTGTFQRIKDVLKQYVELQTEAQYGLVAAWVIMTYFHRLFYAVPFLFVFGKKGCGKTRLLDLLERLSFGAIKCRGISVASLADTLDGVRGSFLIDQAESLSNPKNEDILGIVADSYTVGGGRRRIVDVSNKGRRVLEFETFGPKAFASIKKIDTDLLDRCVEIVTTRATRDFPNPEGHLPIWGELRDILYRLLLTQWQRCREIYQTAGCGVSHRVRELWRPLETVMLLESVPPAEIEDVKAFFLQSMEETQTELSDLELALFKALQSLLADDAVQVLTVSEIAEKIDHNDMTPKQLQTSVGKAIAEFGLHSGKAGRKNGKRAYKFDFNHVNDILSRFCQISGRCGDVVNDHDSNGLYDVTGENLCGQTWSGSGQDRKAVVEDTTSDHIGPYGQTGVVDHNSLNNHAENHQTTHTTEQTEAERNAASNMKPKVVTLKSGQKAEKVGRI